MSASAATATLRLEGEVTIYQAAELKEQLLAPLQHGTVLHVDLSGVTEIDTCGVQLLMLARRAARENGAQLVFGARSASVLEAFELLNLADHFEGSLAHRPTPAAA